MLIVMSVKPTLTDELLKVNSALKVIFSLIGDQCSGGHFRTRSRYLGKKTAERHPISSSFTVFYSCLKPVLHNFKIFIGFRDHYE